MTPRRVLFLCTHNSARSQMGEGLLRHLASGRLEVASAGTEATHVHPLAIRAMREIGIDLGSHTSKMVDAVLDRPWDYVITVCDADNERCPLFPAGTTRLHWSFEDPSQARGTEEQRLATFHRIRDQIHARLTEWLAGTPGLLAEVPPP
jgi:arsenate reductase (thioredoxin)